MHKIISVSSLNLRSMGGRENKHLDEPIPFKCSVCKKRYKLGKNAFVMVRVIFEVGGVEQKVVMCDECSDRFTDISVYGPRGVGFEHVKSTLVRASVQQQKKYCFNCLNGNGSHIFLKYEDEMKEGTLATKRLCAQCSISYLCTLSPEIMELFE